MATVIGRMPGLQGGQRLRYVGQVFDGLLEILTQSPPEGARSRRRIAQIACPALSSIGDRLAEPDRIDDRMRNHQTYRGPAVLDWKHPEVPAGSPLRINREARPLVGPCAHIGAPPRRYGDINIVGRRRQDPAIARERQRRPFDPASQQPAFEVAVETP